MVTQKLGGMQINALEIRLAGSVCNDNVKRILLWLAYVYCHS